MTERARLELPRWGPDVEAERERFRDAEGEPRGLRRGGGTSDGERGETARCLPRARSLSIGGDDVGLRSSASSSGIADAIERTSACSQASPWTRRPSSAPVVAKSTPLRERAFVSWLRSMGAWTDQRTSISPRLRDFARATSSLAFRATAWSAVCLTSHNRLSEMRDLLSTARRLPLPPELASPVWTRFGPDGSVSV